MPAQQPVQIRFSNSPKTNLSHHILTDKELLLHHSARDLLKVTDPGIKQGAEVTGVISLAESIPLHLSEDGSLILLSKKIVI
jgi:hypothetical protein